MVISYISLSPTVRMWQTCRGSLGNATVLKIMREVSSQFEIQTSQWCVYNVTKRAILVIEVSVDLLKCYNTIKIYWEQVREWILMLWWFKNKLKTNDEGVGSQDSTEMKVWCRDIVLISLTVHVAFEEGLFVKIYGNSNSVNFFILPLISAYDKSA